MRGHGVAPTQAQPASGQTQTSKINNATLAPDFSLPTLDGQSISLSDYRGDKPVILDFWASWCHNCQRSMPQTSQLYDKYKDQVEIIGINLSETKGTAQRFIDSHGISFPIAMDSSGRVGRSYGVRYTNTHVLIDKEGNILDIFSRDLTEQNIQALL